MEDGTCQALSVGWGGIGMRVLNRRKKKLIGGVSVEDLKKIKEQVGYWPLDPTHFIILPYPVDILPDGTVVPRQPAQDPDPDDTEALKKLIRDNQYDRDIYIADPIGGEETNARIEQRKEEIGRAIRWWADHADTKGS